MDGNYSRREPNDGKGLNQAKHSNSQVMQSKPYEKYELAFYVFSS